MSDPGTRGLQKSRNSGVFHAPQNAQDPRLRRVMLLPVPPLIA